MGADNSPPTDPASRDFSKFGKRVALIVAVIALGAAIITATHVFLLVFLAILFAVFVRVPANWLAARTPLSKRWALLAVTLALAGVCGGAIALAAPSLRVQAAEMRETLPKSLQQMEEKLKHYSLGESAMDAAENAEDYLPDDKTLARRAAGIFSSALSGFSAVLVVLFLGLCLAIEPRTYIRGLLRLLPLQHRPRASEILGEMRQVLATWLVAALISMSVVGLLTGIGLWALGIPMAFALAVLAGLLAFIPNVGPILAAAPAVLIALAEGPMQALYVVGLYLGVQTVESYLITPFVEKKTVSLPPALTGFMQLMLALFAGLPGVIVAAPLTAASLVLVRKAYVEGVLGDVEREDK